MLGLAAVLVAGGVTYSLAVRDDDPGVEAGPAATGSAAAQPGCSGDYCVGDYRYANACRTIPVQTAARLGMPVDARLTVAELYADSLPGRGDTLRAPIITSTCTISSPGEVDGQYWHVKVELGQGPREALPQGKGTPLAGYPSARTYDSGDVVVATWVRANISAVLSVQAPEDEIVSEDALADVVKTIDGALVEPQGAAGELSGASTGGAPVLDACAVFTAADYQAATGFLPDPVQVARSSTTTRFPETSCTRTTATTASGLPAVPGTTMPDPTVTTAVGITVLGDVGQAREQLASERASLDLASVPTVEVPAIAADAVIGGNTPGTGTAVLFTSGTRLIKVAIDGAGDLDDARRHLEPISKAILKRLR